ncbi:MAG: hypothetical protein J6V66_02965, partial [Clostridia bacterium]|nr:hypothetical protein [Clostridia bacterium]
MKKFSFKSISLKMLALIVSVCACVGFATLGGESVSAAEEPTFALAQTGSIRDGASAGDNYYGLRFETSVNAEWLSQNPAEKYSFGTLIFPASKLGAFNPDVSVDANKNNTDAVKFLAVNNQAVTAKLTYNASIVYDEAKAEELIKSFYGIAQPSPDQIKTVLTNLYAMDMTAVSFVQIGEDTIYTDSYTTSMIKVAARLQSNDVWADRVKEYLGQGKVKSLKTYVVDDNNIVANFDAQESSIAKIVIGNDTLVNGVDYTIADGKLLLDAETVVQKKGVYEDLYVFDSQNNLTIINVLYATDELKTAQDVEDALDYGKYDFAAAEADYANCKYAKHDGVYVLAGDIDMTGHVFNNNVDTATYSVAAYKMQDVGFYGIFDGFGHTISNATVDVKFAYLGNITAETHPNLYAAGVKSWQNHRSYGIFHNVK